MTEFSALQRISAYVAETKLQTALEAVHNHMAVEATTQSQEFGPGKDF